MALTDTQLLSLHEVLEIPYSTEYWHLTGITTGAHITLSNTVQAATTQVQAWLASMSAAALTHLATYLDQWYELSSSSVVINDGSLGGQGIQGVNYSTDRQKATIKERVLVLVPFFRLHETLEKKDTAKGYAWVER